MMKRLVSLFRRVFTPKAFFGGYGQEHVTIHNLASLINKNRPIGVPVKCNTDVRAPLPYHLLDLLWV